MYRRDVSWLAFQRSERGVPCRCAPPKLTPGKLATAWQLYDAKEKTVAEIAEIIGVARSTLYRALGSPLSS